VPRVDTSGSTLAGAGAIASASWLIWRRHTANTLGTTTRVVSAGLAVALLLCAALAVLVSAFVLAALGGAGALPPDADLTMFTRLTAAAALIGGVLPQLLLAATRPRTSALDDVVAVLPVAATARTLGERVPTILLGAVFAVVLSSPLGSFLVMLLRDAPLRAAGAVAAHLLLIVVAAIATPTAFELLYVAACRIRLPHAYAAGAATATLLVVVAAAAGPFLVPHPFDTDGAVVLSPVESSAQLAAAGTLESAAVPVLVLLGWAGIAAALATVAARHLPRAATAEYTRLLAGTTPPRRGAGVAVHALQLVRLPQFLLLGAGPVLLAILLTTPLARTVEAVAEPLAGIPLVAPYSLAMFAFGLTHSTSWWVRGTAHTHHRIAIDRLLASVVVATPCALLAAVILVASGTSPLDTAALRIALGLVLCLAASLGGMLAPWSQLSALSTTITSAVSFLLFALAVMPFQLAAETWMPSAAPATVAVSGVLLLAAWAIVARRRHDDDLSIA
jgi:hypothetical protein